MTAHDAPAVLRSVAAEHVLEATTERAVRCACGTWFDGALEHGQHVAEQQVFALRARVTVPAYGPAHRPRGGQVPRLPSVWRAGDLPPDGTRAIVDREGTLWTNGGDGWWYQEMSDVAERWETGVRLPAVEVRLPEPVLE